MYILSYTTTHHITTVTSKYPRIPGFVGQAKGAKQMLWMLWERGHWRQGLTKACCIKLLKEMPDFQLETSELGNLWLDRGHGYEVGVKCHPEMAGCGVEYCWGKAKYEFRNFINTKTTKKDKQTANVLTALGDSPYEVRYTKKPRAAPLPLFRVRR